MTAMDGYDATTYGERFADVYDEWYHDVSDVDSTVATLLELAAGDDDDDAAREILELGVGTGRLALPLARAGRARGIRVVGVDTSPAMLARLAAHDDERLVTAIAGDMVDELPDGPFVVVFVAYNTIFNLTDPDDQARCFAEVARRLVPHGRFVVEAFVPEDPPLDGDDISVRSMSADRVVLSISRHDAARQSATGQFVEFTEAGGVRLRPWNIRYATSEQLDEMATAAGFELEFRWESFVRTEFSPDSARHVSVYRRL